MEALKQNPAIFKIVETVTKSENFDNFDVVKATKVAKGEGYTGQVFMVTVKDTESDKELDLVIKVATRDFSTRKILPIRLSYQNEAYFYNTISPKFKGLLKEDFNFHPKCFAASLDPENEMLVLENLQKSGFEVFDKYQVLDEKHAESIFKTYGKFHALTFALKGQRPEDYQEIIKNLRGVLDACIPAMEGFFLKCNELANNVLIPGQDDDIIKEYNKYHQEKTIEILKTLTQKRASKYPVILHGDCWSNNMLFKYRLIDDSKKIVEDMRFLDFQMMYEGSPVYDLSYFFYSSGSKSLFDNLDHYLKIYHDSLSSFLKNIGSDAFQVFSFEDLKEEWRKFSKFGFIMALLILKVKLKTDKEVLDWTDGGENLLNAEVDIGGFNIMAKNLLRHMFEIKAL